MQFSVPDIVAVIAALAAGFGLGWTVACARAGRASAGEAAARAAELAALSARLEAAQARVTDAAGEREAIERDQRGLQGEIAGLREEQGRLGAALEAERQRAAEKLKVLEAAETALRDAFKALSADALHTNNQAFLELARAALGEYQSQAVRELEGRQQAIDDLVKPVRESLDRVDARLREEEKERAGAYAALSEQIRSLLLTQQALQGETANLAKALRTPTVRGRWGEIQLRRVVEMAGMLDHCDFYEQQSGTSEHGRLVPDMLVRLPGGRRLVVDAKVPLMAYLEAVESTDEGAREARLKEHARQVRQHMARLSGKAYWEQFQPAPEFAVMFLPGEAFFGAALLHDPALIEAGVDQRVILASPITLIALLRAVAFGWRQEMIAENAQAISDLGRTLYERLRVLTEHVDEVGRSLDGAVTAYNKAVGSMESRVLVAARRLREMGVGVSTELRELEAIARTPRSVQRADTADGVSMP